MILDRLENADAYARLAPGLAEGFAFLRRPDLADLPPGRYPIDGDRIYATLAHDQGRAKDAAKLEAHRKYIDIQYIIAGDETMGWRPLSQCQAPSVDYNAEKDIVFYGDPPTTWTAVPPGSFVVFFPKDAHMPLIGNGPIRKVVIKVAVAGE